MAISRPRTARHAFSFNSVKFLSLISPRFKTADPATRAPGGNNPISASASTVLPLPDSPTRPSDSRRSELERDVVHRPNPSGGGGQVHSQIAHVEQAHMNHFRVDSVICF